MKLPLALQVALLTAVSGVGCRMEEKPPETSTVEVTSVQFHVVRDAGATSHATPAPEPARPSSVSEAASTTERGSRSVTEWTPSGPRTIPPPDLHDMGMHHPPTPEETAPTR